MKKSSIMSHLMLYIVATCVVATSIIMVYVAHSTYQQSTVADPPTTVSPSTVTPKSPVSSVEKVEDNSMMPGLVEVHRKPSSTKVTPVADARVYELPTPAGVGDKIGSTGIYPSTPIFIVSSRTDEKVYYNQCTVAFSVRGKSGFSYAVTAGHCGKVGQDVYSVDAAGKFDVQQKIGTVSYVSVSSFESGDGDWAVIKLDPNAKVPVADTGVPLTVGVIPVKKDDMVCKNGARTGYDCGPQKDKQLESLMGNKTAKLDEVQLCALTGDSGSPVYTSSTIIGVLSATSAPDTDTRTGTCSTNSNAYYTPMADVIKQIRIHVPDALFVPSSSSQNHARK